MRLTPLLQLLPGLALCASHMPATGAHSNAERVLVADGVAGQAVGGLVPAPAVLRGPLAYGLTQAPRHGTVTVAAKAGGAHWRYVPNPGRTGADQFELTASDTLDTAAIRIAVMVAPAPARPHSYYVDPQRGKDHNPGTRQRPLASLQAAHDLTLPGDTVYAMGGRYADAPGQTAILRVTRSGLPGAKITYRAYPGQRPVLAAGSAWNHIAVHASHIRIEGFEIAGAARAIPLADAEAVYARFVAGPRHRSWGPETSRVNTNGITVSAAPKAALAGLPGLPPRHVEIVGNHVHDVPGGGIVADRADYVLIAGNAVHDNARRAIYANSGISLRHGPGTDYATPAYRNIVCNNVVYRNVAMLPWYVTQALSGGNGISTDSAPGAASPPGQRRTLVTGNLVRDNGGAGIAADSGSGAELRRNLSYGNRMAQSLAGSPPAVAAGTPPECKMALKAR